MSERAQAPSLRRFPAAVALACSSLRESALTHWFALGVTGITVAAGCFLAHQLLAWPPHEDEALPLLVGRDSLGDVVHHVTRERGGAPLHFLFAWVVGHLGGGLPGLRAVSATFAIASLPLIACLGRRLADRTAGLVGTLLVATSWAFLFHGIYGRMYSIFLFLSTLTFLALLRALDRSTTARWLLWGLAMLGTVAAHPYGALVLGAQALFVLIARRDRLRDALVAFGILTVVATPFWLTDLVLAGRFDAGVAGAGKLGSPSSVLSYLRETARDFTIGWTLALVAVLLLTAIGLRRCRRELRLFALAVVGFPALAFLTTRFGGTGTPESRHLIFVLPVLAIVLAVGVLAVAKRSRPIAAVVLIALVGGQLGWAWHRTPALFDWEPSERQAARSQAASWLASTSRPDDVLFGYNPLFLQAWGDNAAFPSSVVPRADATLALRSLERTRRPLGRGVWILDASNPRDLGSTLTIERRFPRPSGAFDVRRFGPFLVIRTKAATRTPEGFLRRSAAVTVLGLRLDIADAPLNMTTVERADRLRRGYPAGSSFSSTAFR